MEPLASGGQVGFAGAGAAASFGLREASWTALVKWGNLASKMDTLSGCCSGCNGEQ